MCRILFSELRTGLNKTDQVPAAGSFHLAGEIRVVKKTETARGREQDFWPEEASLRSEMQSLRDGRFPDGGQSDGEATHTPRVRAVQRGPWGGVDTAGKPQSQKAEGFGVLSRGVSLLAGLRTSGPVASSPP